MAKVRNRKQVLAFRWYRNFVFALTLSLINLLLGSCSTKDRCSPEIYGANCYLSDAEKTGLKKRALAGDGCSAYRLADYEFFFGDTREAIRWYKTSYNLGYKKEASFGHYTSLERLLLEK